MARARRPAIGITANLRIVRTPLRVDCDPRAFAAVVARTCSEPWRDSPAAVGDSTGRIAPRRRRSNVGVGFSWLRAIIQARAAAPPARTGEDPGASRADGPAHNPEPTTDDRRNVDLGDQEGARPD